MNRPARRPQPLVPAATTSQRLRPWLLAALVSLFVARPLWPSESAARIGDGAPIVMLALLLFVAWISAGLVDGGLKLRFAALDVVVMLLVVWNVLAALWSAQHDAARPALNLLWEWISLGVMYLLARQLIQSATERRAVVVAMIALATALAAFGLYQYFITMPDTRAQYAADPDGLLRREGLWYPPGSVERELFEQRLQSTEPLSTFALANSLAGFLLAWFVCVVAIALRLNNLAVRRSQVLLAAALALAMIGVCLVLTKSRSAYLAAGVGMMLAAFMVLPYPPRTRARWAFAAIGVAALALLIGYLSGALDWQVLSEAPKSLGYRWQYWQATVAMIADHPWLGVGPGNFGDHYTQYKLAAASEEITDPHNLLLELAATAGVPALILMLALLAYLCRTIFVASDNADPSIAPAGDGDRSPNYVFGGAVVGFVVALFLPWLTGGLIEAPLPLETFAITLGVACIVSWLWKPWIAHGALTISMLSIAALSLVINLLAAGGIGFPAVAGTFWLLLALVTSGRTGEERSVSQVATFAIWTAALLATAACYTTAYQPVLASQSQLTLAYASPEDTEQHLRDAVASDSYGATAPAALAAYCLQQFQAQPTKDHFEAFESAIADAVRRRPYQSSIWLRMGDGYLAGYRALGDNHRLDIAVEAYERAAELYPNHARERARLAIALATAEQIDRARQEAQAALAFDAATTHADQKLRPELLQELKAAGLLAETGNQGPRP